MQRGFEKLANLLKGSSLFFRWLINIGRISPFFRLCPKSRKNFRCSGNGQDITHLNTHRCIFTEDKYIEFCFTLDDRITVSTVTTDIHSSKKQRRVYLEDSCEINCNSVFCFLC